MLIHTRRQPALKSILNFALCLLLLNLAATSATAQQTVYLCSGTYTDRPCKDGREIDIRPTEGAHSISGKRMLSTESQMRDLNQAIAECMAKGSAQYQILTRCDQLKHERESIDRPGSGFVDKDRRFAIRQEQFKLNCKSQ